MQIWEHLKLIWSATVLWAQNANTEQCHIDIKVVISGEYKNLNKITKI